MSEQIVRYEIQPKGLDGKTLSLLQHSGALKAVEIVADGSIIYVRFTLKNSSDAVAFTTSGKLKRWVTIDAAVKWLKTLGIGQAKIEFLYWLPKQMSLRV
ncbi:MAG: hypothetical protein KBT50_01175 [Cycloclasticus sp.]|nr:hypothetical protein [Cycloclasticus sp.]